MKRLNILTALLFIVALASVSIAGWEWQPLGGGNAEKIIVVDESGGPQGAWFFNKDCGTHWIPCTNTTNFTWGDWEHFDAYYTWHMGGDVCEIDGTYYCVSATMQGLHFYQYNSVSGDWEDYGTTSFRENGYYYFGDAQFFADANQDFDTENLIISTWQIRPPYSSIQAGDYKLGLFLVIDGYPPAYNAVPMNDNSSGIDTEGKSYMKIYRDLEEFNVLYTWYGDDENPIDLHKVDITGTQAPYSYTINVDFDIDNYDLLGINSFYQYLDGDNRHQYLLAETFNSSSHTTSIDVWHREDNGGTGFSVSGWEIIQENLDVNIVNNLNSPRNSEFILRRINREF